MTVVSWVVVAVVVVVLAITAEVVIIGVSEWGLLDKYVTPNLIPTPTNTITPIIINTRIQFGIGALFLFIFLELAPIGGDSVALLLGSSVFAHACSDRLSRSR